MQIQPLGLFYINFSFGPAGPAFYVLFLYSLKKNNNYKIEYTTDGITYTPGGTVTGVDSHTITMQVSGTLAFPRVTQV